MLRWERGALGLPLLCGLPTLRGCPLAGLGQWDQATPCAVGPWALLGGTRVAMGVGTVRLMLL